MKKIKIFILVCVIVILILFVLSLRKIPDKIEYGVSFSKFHSDELEVDWREVYVALLDDLEVRKFRFSAHWPNTEPEDNSFNFSELDFQMNEARKRGASVILAVGRRLPGWPECHEPDWLAEKISGIAEEDKKRQFKGEQLLKYIETVVNRYKDYNNILYWQVENEPYLAFFSRSMCGDLDEELLEKEIELIRTLDPERPILITAAGEFDSWFPAYKRGDVFGSSLYLYVWWKTGPIRYPIFPGFFRIKQSLVDIFYGKKTKILIELSSEPWLLQPIVTADIDTILDRMGIDKFNEIINFAEESGFSSQYLWGAEWWYWMKENQNHPEFWERARQLFGVD